MDSLTVKFALATTLLFGVGGMGGEIYSAQLSSSSLAEDYARAAQCEQKLSNKEKCTDLEQISVAKKKGNEEIRELSHTALTISAAIGFGLIVKTGM